MKNVTELDCVLFAFNNHGFEGFCDSCYERVLQEFPDIEHEFAIYVYNRDDEELLYLVFVNNLDTEVPSCRTVYEKLVSENAPIAHAYPRTLCHKCGCDEHTTFFHH